MVLVIGFLLLTDSTDEGRKGQNLKKSGYMYMYNITDSLCCTPETNTTL